MNLSSVPAGATIERAYFTVPGHYGTHHVEIEAHEPDAFRRAVEEATRRADRVFAEVRDSYPANWPNRDEIAEAAAKNGCIVDLRWTIKYAPVGGSGASGLDTTVERMNVRHLDAAHWARLDAAGIGRTRPARTAL